MEEVSGSAIFEERPAFAPDVSRVRDLSRPIMLIGFQRQANLGLGYIAATLKRQGYRVETCDFSLESRALLEAALSTRPLLIGFSLIFQFYVERFAELVAFFRDHGVESHFTMGGHFPSLSTAETFAAIPQLDSIIRFEGEETLLELADVLSLDGDWRGTPGLAYLDADAVVINPQRPLIHNLDSLPYPDRDGIDPMRILGRNAMPLIASRGCARTCSFCSIHVFYRSATGKIVRTRDPRRVVEEMRALFDTQAIRIFLFQDDDFPLFGPKWRKWTEDFVAELHRRDLAGRIVWKINCRADAVEPELFARMRDAGLRLVYMGLESGSEDGLETLHKQITVAQNIAAVEVLKRLGIGFEYGFMLFDPSSTFESVAESLGFLRGIVGDGSAPALFCRMVPYDGTPIKDQLIEAGRFKGDIGNPDYAFLDPRMELFFHDLNRMIHVSGWIHGLNALTNDLQHFHTELVVMEHLFPPLEGFAAYRLALRRRTQAANATLFQIVEETAAEYTQGGPILWTSEKVSDACARHHEAIFTLRDQFVERNQQVLLDALARDGALPTAAQ